MSEIFGFNLPDINITGFLSSTWIYILIIGFIGVVIITAIALLLFFRTYNRKIVVFENISGQGYQPILKTRARVVKLAISGEEILKTLFGGKYTTAYGRKMGRNTYWFAVGPDGYWYNIILGDLDTKMAMLDVEPIDRDVRMFHVALDRLAQNQYDKKSFMEKYGSYMIVFIFLLILIAGIWLIVGRISEATAPLADANKNQAEIAEVNLKITERLDNLIRNLNINEQEITGGSGLVPAE